MTRVALSAVTHTGLHRSDNQDCILVNGWLSTRDDSFYDERTIRGGDSVTVAVFDGMGGHAGGGVASRLAAAVLGATDWSDLTADVVRQRVASAASGVQFASSRVAELEGMGTTVAGVIVTADEYIVFNVGDSSVLRCTEGSVGLLSHADRAPSLSGLGTVLTQSLSVHSTVPSVHLETFPLVGDLRLVVCTDGLSDLLEPEDIRALVGGPIGDRDEIETVSLRLVGGALDRGGDDNVSVVVVDVVDVMPMTTSVPGVAAQGLDGSRRSHWRAAPGQEGHGVETR